MPESANRTGHALPPGANTLRFRFNGTTYTGLQGDTLASALLANGIHFVGRSFKYHRPRGIFSAGSEEPNAIVEIGTGGYAEPNVRATEVELFDGLEARSQNCWPSLDFDMLGINSLISRFIPAGFYYKTFMWPRSFWLKYEHFIRQSAGMGECPKEADAEHYEKHHRHCDVLIAGAGPAGLAAALTAGRSGARVILVDEHPYTGGQLNDRRNSPATESWLQQVTTELAMLPNVRLMLRTTLSGYYDHNFCTLLEKVSDHLPPAERQDCRQRLWKVRAKQVIIASGAFERPLVFADNDRPGIMLASAVRSYINRYGVLPAQQLCVFTNNDSAYQTALDAQSAGAQVQIIDLRPQPDTLPADSLPGLTQAAGISIHWNSAITAVHGKTQVKAVTVHQLSNDASKIQGPALKLDCQCIAASGGWTPNVSLFSQARGKLRFDEAQQHFVPDSGVAINPNISAGACNGRFDLPGCISQGEDAARQALDALQISNRKQPVAAPPADPEDQPVQLAPRTLWAVPCDHAIGEGPKKHFHELQNDSTAADIALAAREGFHSVEHLKRYTTTGMGTDQGKTSNVNALALMAEYRRLPIAAVGTTRFRQPYTPVTFGAIAGKDLQNLFAPKRHTSIQPWHDRHGAVMEDAGGWRRPRYYQQHPGESMHDAVQRECAQVRKTAGMVDASTLGKIDIQGKDAAEFLERIYTNRWHNLAVGQCRYGLMLNEQGMVIDDGVTSRIGEHHYHMTTTTGGAARVYQLLEDYRQTEWPELDVYLTSVTEQWSVISLSGPRAEAILQPLTGQPVNAAAFPEMSWQAMDIAGVPARVFRISFSGEAGYEINVPARYGQYIWEQIWQQGQAFGCVAYGTESIHLLRAEMGFIIVGQDSDGTHTPQDLGMQWIVASDKADFVGKRGLQRSVFSQKDRKQLVGLIPTDSSKTLPEGAQVVLPGAVQGKDKGIGHVTSAYFSPALHSGFAMAMVAGGRQRKGETLEVMLLNGERIPVTVTGTRFLETLQQTEQQEAS
ncbi:sarcosine oxidase subunit alpha family protein [Aliamphritea hakodatensis]|uniref:sarcosine oxidase subunit alpha family protein n=1 Tax=Aliamphritea hakodatensis TaxID=2895352 RepID=UPI0022FD45AA|nr:sarcosine oxidase subunit alpha family protein [Aliamphritea hakodatensis]